MLPCNLTLEQLLWVHYQEANNAERTFINEARCDWKNDHDSTVSCRPTTEYFTGPQTGGNSQVDEIALCFTTEMTGKICLIVHQAMQL